MNQDMLDTQKATLLTREAELSERLVSLQADMMKPHDQDSSEQVVERENDEVVEQLAHETQDELIQVKHALSAIESGHYGECEQCGEDIAPARLETLPYASKCIKCA
ncbi:TraR/DksA family transcriptional regulator [Leucothrix pacifica]|nr:TraR/DksA family transcriptional regulator [Leucothrix pacifica]